MAVTISKLNVILSGNMSGLTSVLNAGAGQVASFEHTIEHAGSHINEILAGVGLGLSIEGIAEFIHHSMEAIDVNTKLADRIGFTTEQLAGLQHGAALAGVSSESLTTGLEKMLKTLGEAAGGGPNPYEKIGLDAKRLVDEAPDQAFKDIADRLSKIENPAQRATAMVEIFGKSGQQLGSLLREGAAGIQAAQDEAVKLGFAFDRVSAAKVEAANDSITRLEHVIEGAGNQLAVGLSPYIDAATVKLVKLATEGDGLGPKVGGAVEWVAKAVAGAADYLELLEAGYYKVTAAAGYWINLALQGIDRFAHGIDNIDRLLGGKGLDLSFLDAFVDGVDKQIDELNRKAGEHWENFMEGKASKSAARAFAAIRAESQSAAEKVAADATKMGGAFEEDTTKGVEEAAKKIAELQKQVDEFGMSKGDKAAHDVALAGGDQAQQAQAKALADQLDQMDQVKKSQDEMAQDAKKMWVDSLTPAEKYANEMAKIETLHNTIGNDGNPLIDDETAARAAAKAADDLAKAGGEPDKKAEGPKLLEAGTNDVTKFVADVQARQRGEEHQREMLAEAKAQTGYLKRLTDVATTPPSPDPVESIFTV